VLPVLWSDNFISLLPGEARSFIASYRVADKGAGRASLVISGWNVAARVIRP